MTSKSLQINSREWEAFYFSEQSIRLTPTDENVSLSEVHTAARILEEAQIDGVTDVVAAYEEIALLYNRMLDNFNKEISNIQQKIRGSKIRQITPKTIVVPVCYELGLDWEEVTSHLSLPKNEIIEKHQNGEYTVAMMGFLPGFLYLSGLVDSLACPRKSSPRTKIPAGAVGIGGTQTGIYSLENPGGWQIIGRTPKRFFDVSKNTPIDIEPGDYIRFTPISEQEFEDWEE